MSTFNLFQEKVISLYKEKKSHDKLHPKLANPSPRNLREYTLIRLSEGLSKEDKQALRDFFDSTSKYNDLESSIQKFELDRLKSVINFMKGKTVKPDESIVKLLAVWIDFEPRPFRMSEWMIETSIDQVPFKTVNYATDAKEDKEKYIEDVDNKYHEDENSHKTLEQIKAYTLDDVRRSDDEKNKIIEESLSKVESNEVVENITKHPAWQRMFIRNRKALRIAGGSALMLAIFVVTYYCIPKQCMCWVDDHYVAVGCQNNPLSGQAIALNQTKLENFKKITRPDTLTEKDENRVWYSKIDNEVEFFTYPGLHPTASHRPLKAATEHILNKYAGKNAKKSKKEY